MANQNQSPKTDGNQSARVAVVAVHGVGKHDAGCSARSMADLLLGLNACNDPAECSPYVSFTEEGIEVPLPGPAVFFDCAPSKKDLWTTLRTTFEERRGFFEDKFRLKNWRPELREKIVAADISNEFMHSQLCEYEGDPLHGKYESFRLAGERSGAAGPKTQVHIYEMYWADLAKRNNSFIRFFVSFYQLLIHLSSLGRTAVDHAALEHTGSQPWLFAQRSYNYAARVLTLGIFNLLVLLPVVAFAPITLLLKDGAALAGATALSALAAAGLAAAAGSRMGRWFGARSGAFFLFFCALVGLAGASAAWAAYRGFAGHPEGAKVTLALGWWIVAYLIVGWIFSAYDVVRSGAKESGALGMVLVAGGFIACFFCAQSSGYPSPYSAAAFMMIQYVFLGLRLFWAFLIFLALLAFLLEFVCVVSAKSREEKARARAAFRTGRFALAVPAVLLILLSIFAWSGVFHYAWNHVSLYRADNPETNRPLPEAPLWDSLEVLRIPRSEIPQLLRSHPEAVTPAPSDPDICKADTGATFQNCQMLEATLFQGAPIGLPAVLLSLNAGFFLLILLAIPSAWQEFKHPRGATNGRSRRLGEWLTGAFGSFRVAVILIWMAAFGVPAFCIAAATICYFRQTGIHPSYMYVLYTWAAHSWTLELILRSGPIVASLAVLMATVGKSVFKSASTVLDTVLDVDNYLRTSPAKDTPRASVVERYVALLHFLHAYRGPDGRGYDRIVIVAHSLGSLISADVLRFLKHDKDAGTHPLCLRRNDARRNPSAAFHHGKSAAPVAQSLFPESLPVYPAGAG